jgi:hypothetical protein
MKVSYLFALPLILFSQVTLASSHPVYKWKFIQNNEIKKLDFKNEEAAKNEEALRKVIGKGFVEEFCSTEKKLLKTHLKDMSKSCDVIEKEITEDTLTAQMVCEKTQNIKFRVRKQPEGHYEGISRVAIDNDDFILQGYSMIKIKNIGTCTDEEIEKSKKRKEN